MMSFIFGFVFKDVFILPIDLRLNLTQVFYSEINDNWVILHAQKKKGANSIQVGSNEIEKKR